MADNPGRLILDRVRKDLVDARFPPASALSINALADMYGVSSIPIREALSALAAEGLVEYVPRRGYHVTSLDYVLLLNKLDLMQMLLTEAAFYLSESEVRRGLVLKIMNQHFPLKAAAFAMMSPYEASSAFSGIFHTIGRLPHALVMERTLFSLAGMIHTKVEMARDQVSFHAAVRHYFKAIAMNLPELSEFGAKRFISDLRAGLLDTLRTRH